MKLTAITHTDDDTVTEYTAEAGDYLTAKSAVLALVPDGVKVLALRDDS